MSKFSVLKVHLIMSNTSTQKSDNQIDDGEPFSEEYLRNIEKDAFAEEEYTKFEECVCSFFDQQYEPTPTLEEYQQDQLKEKPLFANILTLNKDDNEPVCIDRPSEDPEGSILVTGFGIRNLASLQRALENDERRRLYELYKTKKPVKTQVISPSQESSSKKSQDTETEISSVTSDISVQQEKVRYLMGLQAEVEEDVYPQEEELLREMLTKEDKFVFAQSSTMKSAQIYLRTHRISDFFRYIIAHLLSLAPENPIIFILVLLNKILLYRSGTGPPPLLYEKRHIEHLFKLMDRLNSGFIDIRQYISGMNTLGICEFNREPLLSEDGLISREVFIQEVLDSETTLFNDLIKRKWIGTKPKLEITFSSITNPTRSYISGCPLFPSELILENEKRRKLPDETEEA